MQGRNRPHDSGTKTPRRGPLALLGAFCRGLFRRPRMAVRIKDEPQEIYPGMSGREIRRVASQICRSALGASK